MQLCLEKLDLYGGAATIVHSVNLAKINRSSFRNQDID